METFEIARTHRVWCRMNFNEPGQARRDLIIVVFIHSATLDLNVGDWEANKELNAKAWHDWLCLKNITPMNNIKDGKQKGDKGGRNNEENTEIVKTRDEGLNL